MVRRGRRSRESLAQCYGSTIVPTAVTPSIGLPTIRETVISRSPAHFKRGDMRQAYGWTSAILTAAAVVGVLALVLRVLLTGLFVTFITSDLLVVVGFNVCVTVVVGRWLVGRVRIYPRKGRRLGIQSVSYRPPTSNGHHRHADRSTTIDRL